MTFEDGNDADYRLPRSVLPRRYALRIAPDLEAASFSGQVAIDVEVAAPLRHIVCNAAELVISNATLRREGSEDSLSLGVEMDPELERVRFTSDPEIEAGSYVIECAFEGVLNDKLRGFYRSSAKGPDGDELTIATTHFESTDARRAFPCFDEPDLKAVFSVSLDVEQDLFAVSNGAECSVTQLGDGRKLVAFEDTIPMSTYLVCFVVGPLEASEPALAGDVPIRVVTPVGKLHLTPFALEAAVHALGWFTNYFGLPYPGNKLDLVDIPDFAQGAMENLGCITFRETDLLCDPDTSSIPELMRIAEVIEHEIAHMWFGDLVTMKWWNGIWLNEAFATFMSILCLDDFRPEWHRWVSFGREKDAALMIDALHSTRPIEFPVRRPDECEAMFDSLTYLKGGNVLRMLEQYLGSERFRDGVRVYLKSNQYGNTETTDLWDAIESVADGEPVRALMDSWILQGGFPIVTATRLDDAVVELTQAPFSWLPLGERDVGSGPSAIGHDWIVPIRIANRSTDATPEPEGGPGLVRSVLLGPAPHATQPLRVPAGDGLVVLNAGGSGTYRLAYQGRLFDEIVGNLNSLTALERYNLVSDTWAATLARVSPLGDFLALARRLKDEQDPTVWAVVASAMSMMDLAVSNEDRPKLEDFIASVFAPEMERVGFEAQPGEVPEVPRARSLFVGILGTIGADESVRARCRELFDGSITGGAPLSADTVEAVLQVVAWSGGRTEFDAMHRHVTHPDNPLDQWRHLAAMSRTRHPELIAELQQMCLGEVRSQDAPWVLRILLASRAAGWSTWQFVTEHFDELRKRFASHAVPGMLGGIDRLADVDEYGRPVSADEVRAFLASRPFGGHQRTVHQHLERLSVNLGFVREQRPTLGELLRKS